MAPPLFLSYARADWNNYAKPLVEKLRAAELDVWIDQELIRGGDDWMDELNEALRSTKCLILCLSPAALNSRYVKMEYRFYFRRDKPIMPIMCRAIADMPAELDGFQYTPYAEIDKLVARLKREYG